MMLTWLVHITGSAMFVHRFLNDQINDTPLRCRREKLLLLMYRNSHTGDPDVCLLDAFQRHVSLKLPEFWESSASAWFAQMEAQFALREITADNTKYYYVVSALGRSTATRVVSLLKHPPAEKKYTALKTFELSDAERASRLFSLQGLGDSKPSNLWTGCWNRLGSTGLISSLSSSSCVNSLLRYGLLWPTLPSLTAASWQRRLTGRQVFSGCSAPWHDCCCAPPCLRHCNQLGPNLSHRRPAPW